MIQRERAGQKAQEFFDELWARDAWKLESSPYERERLERLMIFIRGRTYGRVLEIGCGAGSFTRQLAGVSDSVLALDVSSEAISRAQTAAGNLDGVVFRTANIMDYDPLPEGPWDLVVMSETIYYLGWLYSFFEVAWLVAELFRATAQNGRLLLANTYGEIEDYLIRPWVIRTYRDLFLNVGYKLGCEDSFRGTKDGFEHEVLLSLFVRPAPPPGDSH